MSDRTTGMGADQEPAASPEPPEEQPARGKRGAFRRVLVVSIALVVVVGAGAAAAGSFAWKRIPAEFRAGTTPGEVVKAALLGGELHYRLADAVWQREVAAIFPMTEDLGGAVKLHLRNPVFLPDPDPQRLRLSLETEAEVTLHREPQRFPGRAVIRTRLRYDPAQTAVLLAATELEEFTFTGEAASVAGALQPVLAEALAGEMEGFPVFTIPGQDGWWARQGVSLVRDVVVEHGQIVVILRR